MALAEKIGVAAPLSWLGLLGGLLFARAWYKADFTLLHPFWSSVFGYFGTGLAAIYLSNMIGIK